MISRYPALLILAASLAGCTPETETGEPGSRGSDDPAPAADSRPVIVFLGTSLTAGLGVDPAQAYPALIQRRISAAGLDYRVVNAGVSGQVSAGSRSQLEWILGRQQAAVLVVETGANDGLRGQDVDALRANLDAILERAKRQDPPPRILVVGMEAPPNLGAQYTSRFRAVYPAVAEKYGAEYLPFLLEGVAGIDSLNQGDGIHPTPAGHRVIAETVWRALEPLLSEAGQASRSP